MKPFYIALVSLIFFSIAAAEDQLADVAKKYVAAVAVNDRENLDLIYADVPTKQKALDAVNEASHMFKSGKMLIGRVDKELVIGDLGVTLVRLESTDPPKVGYIPMICIKAGEEWKVYPWAKQEDLDALIEHRTPEEGIHLQLFNRWASLTEEQIKKEESEDGAK